jgi:hypothetical protein
VTNTQEWQQENSIRAFPFSESILNFDENEALPRNFIVDLKFFPDRYVQESIYLYKVEFNSLTNQYSLEFRYFGEVEQTAISGILYRTGENNQSLVGKKLAISGSSSNPYSVCVFTPGQLWDPIFSEGMQTEYFWIQEVGEENNGIYTKLFLNPLESALDNSVINPGPKTIRRIFIDSPSQPIPSSSLWGKEVEQKVLAGNNIEFEKNIANSVITIHARGGAGEGYPNRPDDLVLRALNTVNSNSNGEVKLIPKDCLYKIEQPALGMQVGLEGEQSNNVESTVQLFSDCLPCCGCDAYRAVSAAISRRSQILKGICDELTSMLLANSQLYNSAVQKINESRNPIVRVRNFRVYQQYFKISVQNVCAVPVYGHIGLSVIGGTAASQDFFIPMGGGGYSEQNLVRSNFNDLPSLPPTNKDYVNQTPEIPTGLFLYYVLGVQSTNSAIQPIPPGSYTDLTFMYSGGIDLRSSGLTIRVESNGIYGGQMVDDDWRGTYGCKKDIYSAKVVEDAPLINEVCGNIVSSTNYKIIEL